MLESRRQIDAENQTTIVRLNELSNLEIRRQAEEIYGNDKGKQKNEKICDDREEEEDFEEEDFEEEDEPIQYTLEQSANLSSDEVGHLSIIDLSSKTVDSILKNAISPEEYSFIKASIKFEPFDLSDYALQLINALVNAPLSTRVLRSVLYRVGNRAEFDLALHHDACFIETTVRHFMDLIESPRNPLGQMALERTAAVYTTIHIINQLFLSKNDIIELGWLEREFYGTEKTKWDGVLFKTGDKSIAPCLVELSGGLNSKTTDSKKSHDISKLYSKMLYMINDILPTVQKQMFCVRFFDNKIYFEQLSEYNGTMFRIIHVSFTCPTSPRLLVEYIKKIPEILAWKEAVVNHANKLL